MKIKNNWKCKTDKIFKASLKREYWKIDVCFYLQPHGILQEQLRHNHNFCKLHDVSKLAHDKLNYFLVIGKMLLACSIEINEWSKNVIVWYPRVRDKLS